jgi:uncharacterized protein YbaA (DUF1428 family)
MAGYVDGFVIAVPAANRQGFLDHANKIDPLFLDLGATRVVECWEEDVPDGKLTDFRRAVQAGPDERIVFAWVEWPSKPVRDAGMAEMDRRMQAGGDPAMDPARNPMPFDGKRMIFGGFETVIDLRAEVGGS